MEEEEVYRGRWTRRTRAEERGRTPGGVRNGQQDLDRPHEGGGGGVCRTDLLEETRDHQVSKHRLIVQWPPKSSGRTICYVDGK